MNPPDNVILQNSLFERSAAYAKNSQKLFRNVNIITVCVLFYLLLVVSDRVQGQQLNYQPTTSSNWNNSANWKNNGGANGIPNGINAQAAITSNIGATTTISLDIPVTLLRLTIGDAGNSFIIDPTNLNNSLTFANGAGDAQLNKSTGTTDFINANIISQQRLLTNITSGVLALEGQFYMQAGSLEKSGGGTLDIRGAFRLPSYTSASSNVGVIVSSGTLQFSNAASTFANTVVAQSGGVINFAGNAASQILSTAVTATPTNVLTLSSTSGLSAGMAVYGLNIPVGTYIQSISGNNITLNNNTSGAIATTDRLVFGGPTYLSTSGVASGVTTLSVNSAVGLVAGMSVAGDGIAAGTTIQSISGTNITLSKATTGAVSTSQSVYFGSSLAPTVASFATSALAASGATTLSVNSITGLAIGMTISGGGIAPGTTISGLTGTTVTLSTPTIGAVNNGQSLTLGSFQGAGNAFATTTSAAGANTITLSSTKGLAVGMLITGTNVPANTTIAAINSSTGVVTLSANLGGTGTAVTALQQFYFGTGQTTFASGLGSLDVSGGTVNIGTNGNAVNFLVDADKLTLSAGTLNLQNGNGGGVTTVLGGSTNLLKLIGGTLNVLGNGAASGTVNFAPAINLQLDGNATFNFTDNVGTIQNFVFQSLNSTSNSSVLRSSAGSATLTIGGDGIDDIFNGSLNFSGSAAGSRIIKAGTETLTLGGTIDNNTARITVNSGTLILAKDSSPSVHAIGTELIIGDLTGIDTVKIGGTYVGLGNVNMTNLRDQIALGTAVTINANGVLDLNGNSEGFNTLAGTGKVTNSVNGTTGILMLGENSPAAFTWSGTIQDGSATAKVSFWKASSNDITIDQAQTYTGETLIGRANLVLANSGGALTGTTQVRVATNGLLFLNDTTNRQTSNNRVNDAATILLDSGGGVLMRRNPTASSNSSETMGTLTVQNGFSQVRTDHTDGGGSTSNNIAGNTLSYIFSNYNRNAGGVVAFTEVANVAGTGFTVATTTQTANSRIQFTTSPTSWLIGDGDSGTVDPKVLIGAYGGTNNGAIDRFVTLDASGYIRLLDQTAVGDFATQITANSTVTSSNLSIGSVSAVNRDDNARISANYTLNIPPTVPGATTLLGEQGFNSWYQTSGTATLSEQNMIRLGGKTADSNYNSTTGSGMMLFSGTSIINGGYLDFGFREIIIRANALGTVRSAISGSNGLTVSGGSRFELQGFNSYSGLTTITQGETRAFTSNSFGSGTGSANGVNVVNATLGVTSGVVIPNKPLQLEINGNMTAYDQVNTWGGDVLVNNNFATGANNNSTIQVNDNAALIINGRITGLSAANGGINGDPSLNGNGQSRGLFFTNNVTNGSAVGSTVGRNGLIVVNGAVTDEDFDGAVASHQKLNLFVRGYTGTTSATNSQFNVFLNDASQTNGQLDLRSGYLHLTNGYASAGGPGGAGSNASLTADAFTGDISLTVDSLTGLTVGTVLSGSGIDVGTTITAIDTANSIITLSAPLISDMSASSSISSGAGGTFTIIRQNDGGNVDRAGTVSALLIGKAGAKFLSPSLQVGEQNGNFSSKSIALLGGEHTSGTVQFGAGNNTLDLNPYNGSSGGGVTSAATPAYTNNGNGTSTFAITNGANLRAGYGVVGTNIPLGTVITSVSGNNITVNTLPGSIPANTSYTYGFVNTTSNLAAVTSVADFRVLATTTASFTGDVLIELASTEGIVPGMAITGTGVGPGVTVSSVDYSSNTIVITKPTSAPNGLTTDVISGTKFNFAYASGSQVVSVSGDQSSTVKAGMGISGTGIQADSKVVDVTTYLDADNQTRTVITLSKTTNAGATFGTTTYSLYNMSNQLQLSDVTGLQIGMGISGTGVRAGSVITAIDPTTGTITLSAATNALINSPNAYSFPYQTTTYNTNTAQSAAGNTIVLFSVNGLSIGSTISGSTLIPNGTTITGINPLTNTITLSAATTGVVGANTGLTIQKISNFAETRLYQNVGGTTDFQLKFQEEAGFGLQNEVGAITKVGRGIAQISGSTQGASDLDGGINVHGGALILAYGGATTNNSRINGGNTTSPYQLTLAGGELRLVSNGAAGSVTENAKGNFTLRPGNSMLIGQAAAFATINLNLGLDNPFSPFITIPKLDFSGTTQAVVSNPDWSWRAPDRFAGATIQFYTDPTTGGTTQFFYSQNALPGDGLNGTGNLGYDTALPYATYKGGQAGSTNHVDFASFIASGTNTLIGDSGGLVGNNLYDINSSNFASNVSLWATYLGSASTEYMSDSSLSDPTTGYSGTLSANGSNIGAINANDFIGAKLIRFAGAVANNTITIGNNVRLALGTSGKTDSRVLQLGAGVADGGAILISDTVGANATKITGGSITSGLLSNSFVAAPKIAVASAAALPGSALISVTSAVGLEVGMTVAGTGVTPGSYITKITGNTIQLNIGLSASVANSSLLEFSSLPQYLVGSGVSTVSGAVSTGGTTIAVSSTSGLIPGMLVSPQIGSSATTNPFAAGTKILSITGNTITLSKPLIGSVADGYALSLDLFSTAAPNTRTADTINLGYPYQPAPATYSSRDLILHNYNTQGVFTLDSQVVDYTNAPDLGPSRLNLVISGPGVTHLTNANNSYTGTTFVSGSGLDTSDLPIVGTLWLSNESRLGATPLTVTPASIYLNGGRLKFADDTTPTTTSLGAISMNSKRGITLGGNGGYVEVTAAASTLTYAGVIRSEDNLQATNVASNQYQGNIGSGDLIKEGLGKLILTNDTSIAPLISALSSANFTLWNAYYGITDVTAGTLQLNISKINSGVLGSNDSTIDGTIVRTGARLDLQITAGAANGTREWITLDGGILGTTASHTDGSLDGVITLKSNSEINVAAGQLRLNPNSGYITGAGSIKKTGTGQLTLMDNNSNFTGGWEINNGTVLTRSQGLPLGSAGSVLLGDNGAVGTGTTAALYQSSRTTGANFTSQYNITNSITVRAPSSGTQTKIIGAQNGIMDVGTPLSATGTWTSGSTTITAGVVSGGAVTIAPGMLVTGAGIPAGAIVTSVNANAGTFVINRATTAAGSSASITVTPFSTNLCGATINGSPYVYVSGGLSNLATGMIVSGTGIPTGSVITAIDPLTNQVTLNANATATTGVAFQTINNLSANTTSGSSTVVLPGGVANLYLGMTVTGTNIPANTTITAISSSSVTLSANASATGSITDFKAFKNFNTVNGSNLVTVSGGVYDLVVGQSLTGVTGITNGTTITAINPATNQITLSAVATATNTAVPGAAYNLGQNNDIYHYTGSAVLNSALQLTYSDVANNPNLVNLTAVNTTSTTTAGSATITVATATGLSVGMEVIGTGIPAGAKITAISGTTITLDSNATATGSGLTLTAATNIWGSQQGGPIRRIALDGKLSGSGNLSTAINLTGAASNLVRTYFELNNSDNTAWVGSLTVGNIADTQTQQHVLRIGSDNAISSANALTLQYNSTLDVAGHSSTIGNLTTNAGAIAANTGASLKGVIIENASNTAATLTINQTTAGNWDALFQDGITPTVYSAVTTATHDNTLSLVKAGSALATVTQSNAYSGSTTLAGGTLSVSSIANGGALSNIGASSNAAGNLIFSGGTLQYTGAAVSTDRLFTITPAGGTLDASGASNAAITFTNTGADITADAAARGAVTTSGSNVISGISNVRDLALGMTVSIPGSGITNAVITAITPGTGNNNSSITVSQNATASLTATASFGVIDRTFILTGTSTGANSLSGVFSDSVGGRKLALTKLGAGTWVLSGTATNTYSGDTTIGAGVLRLGANNVLPDGTGKGNILVNMGAVFDLNGKSDSINGLSDGSGGGGIVDNVAGAGSSTLTIGGGNATASFSGVIKNTTGTVLITKTGTGTETLSGNNTYSGLTTVSAGTLTAANINALGATTAGTTVSSGGTLNIANVALAAEPITLNGSGAAGSSGALTGTGTASTNALGAITLQSSSSIGAVSASDTFTINGVIGESVSSALTVAGLGTVELKNANTYTGLTNVTSGATLIASNSAALGTTAAGTVVASGGTLKINNVALNAEAITLNGTGVGGNGALIGTGTASESGTVTLGSNSTAAAPSGSDTLTVTGQVTGSFGLTSSGAGIIVLGNANNNYTTTTVSSGTLQVGVSGVGKTGTGITSVLTGATLAGSGSVQGAATINSGATLSPGDNGGTSISTLGFLGDLNLLSGSTTLLTINSASTADKITVAGALTLAHATNSIQISLSGYTPVAGNSWDLLDWATINTSSFNVGTANRNSGNGGGDLLLPTLTTGLGWNVSSFLTTGVISVVAVVPEPNRLLLISVGLMLVLCRRKRQILR